MLMNRYGWTTQNQYDVIQDEWLDALDAFEHGEMVEHWFHLLHWVMLVDELEDFYNHSIPVYVFNRFGEPLTDFALPPDDLPNVKLWVSRLFPHLWAFEIYEGFQEKQRYVKVWVC